MPDSTPPKRTGRDLVIEAVVQAGGLGWRTISLSRLARLADGDETALPLGAPHDEQPAGGR
ncbi:hypothetical protein ACQPXT_13680 [Streptomyces sp. CA-100214]